MEMYRGRIEDKDRYSDFNGGIIEVRSPVQKDPVDRPHEQWALRYFGADNYEKAAKLAADDFDFEDNGIQEAFENGYWTIWNEYHRGQGKTKDAAWIDFSYDEAYNYEGD